MRNRLVWLSLGITLISVNLSIVGKERLLRDGQSVLLELAPRDPRSLLQGDFMALRYRVSNAVSNALTDGVSSDGTIVVSLDAELRGTFVRFDDGSPLDAGEVRMRYRKRGEGVRIASESFFFEEGQGPLYQGARFGEVRVGSGGDAVLVGLRDEELRVLRPE